MSIRFLLERSFAVNLLTRRHVFSCSRSCRSVVALPVLLRGDLAWLLSCAVLVFLFLSVSFQPLMVALVGFDGQKFATLFTLSTRINDLIGWRALVY